MGFICMIIPGLNPKTKIIRRGVSDFATGFPCYAVCRRLTACPCVFVYFWEYQKYHKEQWDFMFDRVDILYLFSLEYIMLLNDILQS